MWFSNTFEKTIYVTGRTIYSLTIDCFKWMLPPFQHQLLASVSSENILFFLVSSMKNKYLIFILYYYLIDIVNIEILSFLLQNYIAPLNDFNGFEKKKQMIAIICFFLSFWPEQQWHALIKSNAAWS